MPFDQFAESWVRNQVILPTEREIGDHLAPGTARSYASHIRFHLVPYFGGQDLRSMSAESVQSFYDRCVETGCPRSQRTIAMVIMTLGMVLAHARVAGINPTNAVQEWKLSRGARFHLVPYFGGQDVRSMSADDVRSFYDRCVERAARAASGRSRW